MLNGGNSGIAARLCSLVTISFVWHYIRFTFSKSYELSFLQSISYSFFFIIARDMRVIENIALFVFFMVKQLLSYMLI